MNIKPVTARFAIHPLAAAIALCSGSLLAGSAQAQEPGANGPMLEEVLVTAQKRVESLQDVPISVNAVSGEKMQEAGIDRIENLAPYVPNLSMAENGIGTAIYIRGIGSGINAGFEQSAGMYMDGIYYGRAQLSRAPFLDLERIEVLRGPQPILFGKNSIAGAVSMITAKPTDQLEGSVSMLYEPDTEDLEGTAVISGPLTDSLAGRLAVRYREIAGYMDNIHLGDDEADREESTVRGTLRWDATDDLQLTLKGEIGSFDVKGRNMEIISDNPSVIPSFGGLTYSEIQTRVFGQPEAGLNVTQDHKRTSNGDFSDNDTGNVTLTIDYAMGEHTLTSVTGYVSYEFDEHCDCDFSSASVLSVPLDEDYDQFSQELRLTSPGGETLDYIVGLFYQTSELDSSDTIGVPADSILVPAVNARVPGGGDAIGFTGASRIFTQDSDIWAAFAQVTWNISDQLRLTAGGRYTVEEKDGARSLELFNLDGTQISDPVQAATATTVFGKLFNVQVTDHDLKGSRDEDSFTPLLTLQYDWNEDTMVYATASTGFKSGGFDARGNVAPDSDNPFLKDPSKGSFEYEDEEATNFELGTKTRFADGAAELNAALFFTTYDDLQVSIFDGTLGFLVDNAAEAEVMGVEIDGRWAATDKLTLSGSVAWTDFEFQDFESGQCNFSEVQSGACRADGTISYEGRTNQYVADWSGRLSGDYFMPISSTLEGRATIDLLYSDEYFPSQNLDPSTLQDSYWKVNARLAISSTDGSWEVAMLGRNLTDEDVVNYSNPVPLSQSSFGVLSHFGGVDQPRSFAVQASYRF
jgi:outer membrane receptor protein involved in Fe transport